MGRKGLFSSAAAGGSLVAASVVLVIAVSAVIGFRGFRSARDLPAQQSVVLSGTEAAAREAGAAAKPAPVVIGGASRPAAARGQSRAVRRKAQRGRRASRRRARLSAQARSGLALPARRKRPVPAGAPRPSAPDPTPAPDTAPQQKSPTAPVDGLVDGLSGSVESVTKDPVESVGDVLLDLRDALP